MKHTNHYWVMLVAMLLSGVLSTMNVWVDNWQDMRISINDLYMIGLMTGWMFFFMGVADNAPFVWGTGLAAALLFVWCIRTQFLVSEAQYRLGMIPHHSMAVHMSKQLLNKPPPLSDSFRRLVENIVETQQKEIAIFKEPVATEF